MLQTKQTRKHSNWNWKDKEVEICHVPKSDTETISELLFKLLTSTVT